VLKRFTPVLAVVAVCWIVFAANAVIWDGGLTRHGIIPRQVSSLPAVLWAPFLHANLQHLVANTLPLLILGAVLCARGRIEFLEAWVAGTLLGGGLTWLFARNASHIGASGVIFTLFGYLVSLAFFRRTFGTLLLSLACLVFYGGMIRGIMPTSAPISWEGHLAGLIAGIGLGWIRAKMHSEPEPENSSQLTPTDRPSG
jgi:membrane associated rhomboid family serine protease